MFRAKLAALLTLLLAAFVAFPAAAQTWDDSKAYVYPNPSSSLNVWACNYNTGFSGVRGYVLNPYSGEVVGYFYIGTTGCTRIQFYRSDLPNGVYEVDWIVNPGILVDVDAWIYLR